MAKAVRTIGIAASDPGHYLDLGSKAGWTGMKMSRQFHKIPTARVRIMVAGWSVQQDPPTEDVMKSDWLPEAMLALAFAVALLAQSAEAFR